ncbi:MAG: hypothetical protein ACOH1Q_07755 [Thiobacillus sp.]
METLAVLSPATLAVTSMNPGDIITVIRDPDNTLGKLFWRTDDGETKKDAEVRLAFGLAVQHHIQDVGTLEKLFAEVSEDPHAAICNSVFPLIPVGSEFALMSKRRFQQMGVNRGDPKVIWPVTTHYNGKDYPALGRWTEHSAPSSWVLLDRDIDEFTPPHFADLSYEEWLAEVDRLLPGVLKCARLRAHSSSARVSYQGKPVGGGSGHTWLQLANAADVGRLRGVVMARAIAMDMSWKKPRYSRETGEVVGHSIASILDWSVFTPGRLVFVGKPGVQNV